MSCDVCELARREKLEGFFKDHPCTSPLDRLEKYLEDQGDPDVYSSRPELDAQRCFDDIEAAYEAMYDVLEVIIAGGWAQGDMADEIAFALTLAGNHSRTVPSTTDRQARRWTSVLLDEQRFSDCLLGDPRKFPHDRRWVIETAGRLRERGINAIPVEIREILTGQEKGAIHDDYDREDHGPAGHGT